CSGFPPCCPAFLPLLCRSHARRGLLSFPTRRSSDLLKIALGFYVRGWRSACCEGCAITAFECPRNQSSIPHNTRTTRINTGKLRSEEHTSELQSRENRVCRPPLEKKTSCSSVRRCSA